MKNRLMLYALAFWVGLLALPAHANQAFHYYNGFPGSPRQMEVKSYPLDDYWWSGTEAAGNYIW